MQFSRFKFGSGLDMVFVIGSLDLFRFHCAVLSPNYCYSRTLLVISVGLRIACGSLPFG